MWIHTAHLSSIGMMSACGRAWSGGGEVAVGWRRGRPAAGSGRRALHAGCGSRSGPLRCGCNRGMAAGGTASSARPPPPPAAFRASTRRRWWGFTYSLPGGPTTCGRHQKRLARGPCVRGLVSRGAPPQVGQRPSRRRRGPTRPPRRRELRWRRAGPIISEKDACGEEPGLPHHDVTRGHTCPVGYAAVCRQRGRREGEEAEAIFRSGHHSRRQCLRCENAMQCEYSRPGGARSWRAPHREVQWIWMKQ